MKRIMENLLQFRQFTGQFIVSVRLHEAPQTQKHLISFLQREKDNTRKTLEKAREINDELKIKINGQILWQLKRLLTEVFFFP